MNCGCSNTCKRTEELRWALLESCWRMFPSVLIVRDCLFTLISGCRWCLYLPTFKFFSNEPSRKCVFSVTTGSFHSLIGTHGSEWSFCWPLMSKSDRNSVDCTHYTHTHTRTDIYGLVVELLKNNTNFYKLYSTNACGEKSSSASPPFSKGTSFKAAFEGCTLIHLPRIEMGQSRPSPYFLVNYQM